MEVSAAAAFNCFNATCFNAALQERALALLSACRCALNRPDSCSEHNRLSSSLWVMVQLPGEASVIYVGNSGGVYRCPTATRDSCATVATSKYPIVAMAPVASALGVHPAD